MYILFELLKIGLYMTFRPLATCSSEWVRYIMICEYYGLPGATNNVIRDHMVTRAVSKNIW